MSGAAQGNADWDVVTSLHENPTFLSKEHIQFLFFFIGSATALLNVFFFGTFAILKSFGYGKNSAETAASKKTSNGIIQDNISRACLKGSYAISCFLMNALVSCLGLYHMMYTIKPNASVEQRIQGMEPVAILPSLHIAYQLWALPVGIFFVEESAPMLLHHVAVSAAAALGAFFTNGFRYSTPFFYGVVEFSSLPLGIMNSFKENPSWIKSYPQTYAGVRIVFAVTFLWFRVVMWLPRMHDFLHLSSILLWTCSSTTCRVQWGIYVASAWVLTLLQLYWAQKIVAAVLKKDLSLSKNPTVGTKQTETRGYGSVKRQQ